MDLEAQSLQKPSQVQNQASAALVVPASYNRDILGTQFVDQEPDNHKRSANPVELELLRR
jgi:hypothetical protein